MKELLRSVFYLFLIALVTMSTGCGNGKKKELNRLLVELAAADQTIDASDWKKLTDFLDAQKVNFKDLYDDGTLDVKAVEDYVNDFFAHRRPAQTVRFIGVGGQELSFHVFIERSGSMTPYDSPAGDGSFHAAIMALRNNLPGNSKVENIGEQGYTDFRKIFDQILNRTGKDQISILVTDMIYSVKDMNGVNPQKVFNEAQGMINAVFKDEVKKKAMLVIKMDGSYNGPYYAYDNSVRQFDGRRPYYIIIVGDNDSMSRLTMDKELLSFSRFTELKGYDNMYLFAASEIYQPYYSLLLSNPAIRGRFQPERGQEDQIKDINGVETDRNSGDIRLALAVDLGHMLIDKGYLTDPANYRVESDDEVTIREIRPINGKDVTPAEKKYLNKATHIFILEMKQMRNDQEVSVQLLNRLPAWVEASSADDDIHGLQPGTTFGLKYLLQGIYNSYQKNTDGTPCYFELKMKFND